MLLGPVHPGGRRRMSHGAHTLRLVLGDQLNPAHSWFERSDPGVVHVLMEVRQETDYVLHHAQKLLARMLLVVEAAMQEYLHIHRPFFERRRIG